jgi:biotin carboxyl carrier protein
MIHPITRRREGRQAMSLTPEDVRNLLAAFEAGPWSEMTVHSGRDRVSVSRRPFHRVTDGIPSSSAATEVRSPSIGVFHRAAIEIGTPVRAADPIGFVEVMDRVMPVPAGGDGTVGAFLADDGATVEYGERLALVVAPEGEHGLGNG